MQFLGGKYICTFSRSPAMKIWVGKSFFLFEILPMNSLFAFISDLIPNLWSYTTCSWYLCSYSLNPHFFSEITYKSLKKNNGFLYLWTAQILPVLEMLFPKCMSSCFFKPFLCHHLFYFYNFSCRLSCTLCLQTCCWDSHIQC